MPVYGAKIRYTVGNSKNYTTRVYFNMDSLSDTLDNLEIFVGYLTPIAGEVVTFNRLHVWQPGNPGVFSNRTISIPGELPSTNPMKDELCYRITFEVEGTYPLFIELRPGLESSAYVGHTFSSAFTTDLVAAAENLEVFLGFLCSRDGTLATGITVTNEYFIHQLSKRWYNRPGS